jgi:hypothetical protein
MSQGCHRDHRQQGDVTMATTMEIHITEHAGEVERHLMKISEMLSSLGWEPIFQMSDEKFVELHSWHVLQAVKSGKIIGREIVVIQNSGLLRSAPISIVTINRVEIEIGKKFLDDTFSLRFILNGGTQIANFSPQVDADFQSSSNSSSFTLLAVLRKDEIGKPGEPAPTTSNSS